MKEFLLTVIILFLSAPVLAENIYSRNDRFNEDREIETVILPFGKNTENSGLSSKITERIYSRIKEFEFSFPEIEKTDVTDDSQSGTSSSFYITRYMKPDGSHPEFVIRCTLTKRVEKIQVKEKSTYMKYIIENKKNEYYTLTAEFIDLYNDKILETYTKEFREDKYSETADEFCETVRKYYKPRLYKSDEKLEHIQYSTVSACFVLPVGKYSEIAKFGTGLNAAYYLENIFRDDFVFSSSLSFNYYLNTASNICNYFSLNADAGGGYSFYNLFLEGSKLIVLAKTGYIFHFIKYTTESKIFYDPYLSLSSVFNYRVTDNVDISLSASLNTFFEVSDAGMFLQLNAGASYIF